MVYQRLAHRRWVIITRTTVWNKGDIYVVARHTGVYSTASEVQQCMVLIALV